MRVTVAVGRQEHHVPGWTGPRTTMRCTEQTGEGMPVVRLTPTYTQA